MSQTKALLDFFERQMDSWPEAAERYDALAHIKERVLNTGKSTNLIELSAEDHELPVRLQFNPARAVSTAAKVDKAAIAARPCFLCKDNRPASQIIYTGFEGYDTLVNPFPIFPKHFTIACKEHRHQDTADFREMARIAKELPGMTVFYNGSQAGASAPDHLHFQAGNKDFLPVCSLLEKAPGSLMYATSQFKAYYPDTLPISAVHFISEEVDSEMLIWINTLLPTDDETLLPNAGMRNLLMWVDDNAALHTLFMPRAKHRPECYYAEDGFMVSPGAVDMAGVIILPRHADFEKISMNDIRHIYDEVSFEYRDTERFQRLMLR